MPTNPADQLMNLAIDGEPDADEVEIVRDNGATAEDESDSDASRPPVKEGTIIIEE